MKKYAAYVLLVGLLLLGITAVTPQQLTQTAQAQTTSSQVTLREDFANGSFPPALNQLNFNHSFTLGTAWDLTGSTINEPLSQSPPYALTLYAGNEDRVTFNQPSSFSYVSEARVWGWTLPASESLPAGRGRVVFEGSGDTKTFFFYGGGAQWRLFEADATDVGDNGRILGEIRAVRLADVGNNGNRVMFDDLELLSVTPPRRSNLTLMMTGSTSNVNIGDIITYDLTVTNSGPQDAPQVTIANTLPFGGTFVAGSSSSTCHLSLGQVVCDLGTLLVNGTRTVTIAVQVGNDACATFTNRATVTAQALDSNMADNTAVHTATTSLPACADYATSLTALPVPVDVGSQLTYELVVKNNGPDASVGTATITFPAQVAVLQHMPDSGVACSMSGSTWGSTWNCTVSSLVGGQEKRVIFTAVTSPTAAGMQTAVANSTPILPDPNLTNNSTRFRFALGLPFTFTEIAELGTGMLAAYDSIHSLDIDESGNVAFIATAFPLTTYGVFVGDGQTLTQRFVHTDLPALANGLVYRVGFSCADLGDFNNTITLVSEVHDPAIDPSLSNTTRVGSLLHVLNADGSFTTLDTQTRAEDGWGYRIYSQPTHWRSGIAVPYEVYDHSQPDGVTHFVNGQDTDIYQAAASDIRIDQLSSNADGLTWTEEQGFWFSTFKLMSARWQLSSGWSFANLLPNQIRPFTNEMIGNNDFRGIAYSQAEQIPATGTTIESFYLAPGLLPAIRSMSTDPSQVYSFRKPVLNNEFRYALRSQNSINSYYGVQGIFTGPDPVAHRVVRASFTNGDVILGSRVTSVVGQFCPLAINDAGQIVFVAGLQDGRAVVLRAEPTTDNDGDGVTDWLELGGPNHGDSNGDQILDSVQPNVASVPNGVDGTTVTFTTDPNFTLTNVQAVPNPSPGNAPGDPFRFGHFAFELTDVPAGGAATVEVTLPFGPVRNWWKYGRTPNNPTPHWYNFAFNGTTGAVINGNMVTLHFVDGQRGDDDLTANGVIVDPGGPTGFPFNTYLPLSQK
ncbi:MAG: hypothetical protein CL608_00740 [Anaerolineaceae bacterium]|nr:hypothetical protein [Anaerolineaceae bacterium]